MWGGPGPSLHHGHLVTALRAQRQSVADALVVCCSVAEPRRLSIVTVWLISQSGRQTGRQAVSEAGRQVGRQAGRNTRFGFCLVAAYIYKRWRTASGQAKTAVEFADGHPSRPHPVPHGRPRDRLSLGRFTDQGSNPTKHKLLTPPPHLQTNTTGATHLERALGGHS